MANSTYTIVQNFVSSLIAANDAQEFNQTDKRMRAFARSCPSHVRSELVGLSDALRRVNGYNLLQLVA